MVDKKNLILFFWIWCVTLRKIFFPFFVRHTFPSLSLPIFCVLLFKFSIHLCLSIPVSSRLCHLILRSLPFYVKKGPPPRHAKKYYLCSCNAKTSWPVIFMVLFLGQTKWPYLVLENLLHSIYSKKNWVRRLLGRRRGYRPLLILQISFISEHFTILILHSP